MDSINSKISNEIRAQQNRDDELRVIFRRHFELEKNKENVGYVSWATYGVEVAIAIANIIMAVQKPGSNRGFRAISDLVYGLNSNEFWVKNAPVLVPILTVVLNSHKDYIDMAVRRDDMNDYSAYDKLMSSAQIVPLELFSILLYLVGGPMLMSLASLPLKQDLLPYILG